MEPLQVTLYGRPGCHLCEEAAAMLAAMRVRIPLDIQEVNIEDDDALLARYVFEIPVVAMAGVEIAKAPIARAALEAALRRAAK